ncbi:FtsX-like permease family protein [Nocardioides sp. URHA0020]|uniref:FtsX-like permease family protein n=1 Tax=Nocardioides sp. URHA0020 TaxID=1380392 RepID=UPI00048EFC87|nr:FtsX-like permease family protein [Nocardioides sp. URHA0020]
MLSLVLRRARGQLRLVAAVVALVAVAATLLGVCALLLGPTQDRAFDLELQPGQQQDAAQGFAIDAFLVRVRNDDIVEVRESAADQLREVVGAFEPRTTVVETSAMRSLAGTGDPAVGYLSAGDGIKPRSELVSGRWPASSTGAIETTVPEAVARRLGLAAGDEVRLGDTTGLDGLSGPMTLVVVGTFRPASDLGWESDPLTGAGVDPDHGDGATTATAYGPFVIDDAAFLASGSAAARLRVTARPVITDADRESVTAAVQAYDGAEDRLAADLADRVQLVRLDFPLPDILEGVETNRAASRSLVLVTVLLGGTLSLTALLLAGRLVAAVRDEERALLVAFGASPRQQLRATGLEAVLLALVAAALALPAAALLHSRLTHLAGPNAAGLAQAPTVTAGLVLTVLGCCLVLAPVLALAAFDTSTTTAATRRRWALDRVHADWTLIVAAGAAAVLAWWQLRDQPDTTTGRGDVALTLAPVVCVVATTLVVLRLVPVLLRVFARLARRSPALVLPLAAQQAARRPHPGTAMALIATAVATATFGLGLRSTWERSQVDQADLRVGTDLSLAVRTTPTQDDAAAVLAAVDGESSAVSAVIDRPVAIGRYAGSTDAPPPTLVAVDSDEAGDLLRGRLDGGTWAGVGARLDPGPAVPGLVLADDTATVQGRAAGTLPVTATTTAVVEDTAGVRHTRTAAPVRLDGTVRPLVWSAPAAGLRLVALALHLDAPRPRRDQLAQADVALTVTLPGVSEGGTWHAQPQDEDPVLNPSVTVRPAADAIRLRAGAVVDTGRLSDGGGDLLVTAFVAPDAVPVALSEDLADAIGARTGDLLEGDLSTVGVPLEVVAVVSDVPSAPGRPAVLADADTVSRSLIAGGQLEPFVDAWWVGDPTVPAEQALSRLEQGSLVTRAGVTADLARGPFEVIVPTVLTTLVVAAVVLLLAGIALVAGADQRRRVVELTRLRALGLPRRGAQRLMLAEYAASLAPLLCLGVLVGLGAAWVLGPLMVRSDVGAAPVPTAVLDWPWGSAALALGGAVLGSTLVAWAVAVRQVRASDRAGLRTGDS